MKRSKPTLVAERLQPTLVAERPQITGTMGMWHPKGCHHPIVLPPNFTNMKRLCADDVTDSMPLFRGGRGGAIPTSALQLQISRCNVHRACDLNALWHSRFPKIDWSNVVRNKDYACYVAEYDDIAYAVAIWSSPIAANRLTEGKTALELRRMAICDNAPPNTASRVIGIMRRIIAKEMPHLTLLVSYQDTDVHAGTIYKASGWKAVAQNKGTSWTNENRQRNEEQSLADKVRWEYRLARSVPPTERPPEDEAILPAGGSGIGDDPQRRLDGILDSA